MEDNKKHLPTETGKIKHLPTKTGKMKHLPTETGEIKHLPTKNGEIKHLPTETEKMKHLLTKTGEMKHVLQNDAKQIDGLEWFDVHTCQGCNHPIRDQFILRLMPHSEWHMNCLTCDWCKCCLGNASTCYVKNDKTYCKKDYHRLFARRCAGCKTKLYEDDLVIKVNTSLFHIGCFRCFICQVVLVPGDPFWLKSKWILCKRHYSTNQFDDTNEEMQTDPTYCGASPWSHQKQNASNIGSKLKATRIRTILSNKQLDALQACYATSPRPHALLRIHLVEITGLSLRVIRVWFQNRRCKDKKRLLLGSMKGHIENKVGMIGKIVFV